MSATDRIEVIEGDITRLEVDAIVNAANESLLGGGEEALNTIFRDWAVALQACDSPKRADNMLRKGAQGRQSIRWIVAYNAPHLRSPLFV